MFLFQPFSSPVISHVGCHATSFPSCITSRHASFSTRFQLTADLRCTCFEPLFALAMKHAEDPIKRLQIAMGKKIKGRAKKAEKKKKKRQN